MSTFGNETNNKSQIAKTGKLWIGMLVIAVTFLMTGIVWLCRGNIGMAVLQLLLGAAQAWFTWLQWKETHRQ